jgi:drug/metabolite transporter (DMT)-like permease
MTFGLGVASALVAPSLMVVGFIIWDNHWTGSAFALNMYKCNLTAIGFAIVSLYIRYFHGGSFPSDVFTLQKVGALMLSSTIGILIGDWTWLEGMRLLGARKIIVMDSLKPFLAALLGQVFLGERLKVESFVGLFLTVVGVTFVGMEQDDHQSDDEALSEPPDVDEIAQETDTLLPVQQRTAKTTKRSDSYAQRRKNRIQSRGELVYGAIMAALNVILHTFGALLTKKFGVGMTTFEINFIRFGFAGFIMAMLSGSLSLPQLGSTVSRYGVEGSSPESPWFQLPKAPRSMWLRISIGVAFVSFLTPALTNYAMFQISLALLLTLESIGPLYSLPLAYVLQGDKPTIRASIGAVLAVVGIMILSFRGMTID